jgi:hypothetical protein
MGTRSAPPFHLSPSTIARYFFHNCERFLFYSGATPQTRKRESIPAPEFDQSPLFEAILGSGYQWEEEVVQKLLRGRVVVGPGSGALHTRRLPLAQTLSCLRREPAGSFLYQPTLVPPPAFYEAHGIDPGLVAISENHPDLIAIEEGPAGTRLLRVVDLKRGEALKLTHRVQILFYALELQALLDSEGIRTARVDLEQGAVWLGKQPQPELFPLGDFRPHLERFLRHDLGRVLAGSARDSHWHLYDRCEWCEFFGHCREEMQRTDDVSQLAQLTTYGKRHLREEAGVQNLVQLGKLLQRADADEILDRCASLAGQRHRLAVRVAALQTRQPQLHGSSCPDLPLGENVGVFLTLQKEPLGQSIYLAGVHVTVREDLRPVLFSRALAGQLLEDDRPRPCVWLAETSAETARVRRQLVELLDELFRRVHHYNEQQPEWKDQLTLQAYVHTEDERRLLFTALLEALQEPDLADRAMTLLFHFQGPELMQASRHPGTEIAYPVVVLQSAVSRLLALPVEVSYTLPEMLEALGSPFHYRRRDYYHFPLGHGLRAEALHAAWYGGRPGNLDEIRQQARLYLLAVAALLRAVREQARQHLFAWPPRFTLPTGAGIREPLLSRLAFFARYESLLRCLAIREARTEARATQLLLGQVIELEALTSSDLRIAGELPVEPEADTFPSWLLVRDTEEGRRAQLEYGDYWYRNKVHGGPDSPHRAVVGIEQVFTADDGVRLRLHYARPFKNNPPRPGERFLLYQRFTDFTTDGLVGFLEELDRTTGDDKGPGSLFLKLLRQPEEAATPLPLAAKVRPYAGRGEGQLGFTPSQQAAYQVICWQRVTAVWGPPGTGKTHFLASAIVGLAAAHARAGLPFRVLVTAFTHAAIENLLRKIAQRKQETGLSCPLDIGKAKYWQGAPAGIAVVPESDVGGWVTDTDQTVLGATVYSCLKKRRELPPFDLVVIDEASQVRVPEAAVAVTLVAPKGRLVLAGDHLQLPPIVAGVYPATPPNEPLLHRSIFEAACPRGDTGADTRILRQLLENFRMNDVLTGCAADLLYGSGYRCSDSTVARRRLPFKARRGLDPLAKACLDPDYPLVLVVIDGLRSARANPVEADLVAQLVVGLREGLRDSAGRPYRDEADFFRHGVFVVSPHHAQIRAIRRELAALRPWTHPPFVDTVDKMQGQEAEAVVVSYGVADPEFALHEAEFIYGLNRLNVAITRARTKTVVCLPRPLLEASPQVLDVPEAAAGLGFMRRLVERLEDHGDELVFEAETFEARVLRLGKTR